MSRKRKAERKIDRRSAIVYWLVPAAPSREFFRALIADLAARNDAPRFEPHLTLGLSSSGDDDGSKTFARLSAKTIELRARGVDFSARFTRTLFVRFDSRSELVALRASLGARADEIDPHVSLLYKKLPMKRKTQLASSITLPFSTVTFDTVQIVRCSLPVRTRCDVESWQTLGSQALDAGRDLKR